MHEIVLGAWCVRKRGGWWCLVIVLLSTTANMSVRVRIVILSELWCGSKYLGENEMCAEFYSQIQARQLKKPTTCRWYFTLVTDWPVIVFGLSCCCTHMASILWFLGLTRHWNKEVVAWEKLVPPANFVQLWVDTLSIDVEDLAEYILECSMDLGATSSRFLFVGKFWCSGCVHMFAVLLLLMHLIVLFEGTQIYIRSLGIHWINNQQCADYQIQHFWGLQFGIHEWHVHVLWLDDSFSSDEVWNKYQ